MKVLPHRHDHSAALRNQLSVTHHELVATPSCFYRERPQYRKQLQALAATPSTPLASISKTPVAVHCSSVSTTSLPTESTEATVTVPQYEVPKKKETEASLINKWPQPIEFRSWKISFKSEVYHPRNTPEPLSYGLLTLRMPQVLTSSLPQHL